MMVCKCKERAWRGESRYARSLRLCGLVILTGQQLYGCLVGVEMARRVDRYKVFNFVEVAAMTVRRVVDNHLAHLWLYGQLRIVGVLMAVGNVVPNEFCYVSYVGCNVLKSAIVHRRRFLLFLLAITQSTCLSSIWHSSFKYLLRVFTHDKVSECNIEIMLSHWLPSRGRMAVTGSCRFGKRLQA